MKATPSQSSFKKLATAKYNPRPHHPLRGREAPLEGHVEFLLRSIWFHLVGGGAPDIQRNIIAQRGLGLPRQ